MQLRMLSLLCLSKEVLTECRAIATPPTTLSPSYTKTCEQTGDPSGESSTGRAPRLATCARVHSINVYCNMHTWIYTYVHYYNNEMDSLTRRC